jgi:AbrB family looped-hinge helix DNA binding protein
MDEGIKLYGSATVGSKGQIVIPADARGELHFKEGDKVVILRAPRGGILVVKADVVEQMLGAMQTRLETMTQSIKNMKGTQ